MWLKGDDDGGGGGGDDDEKIKSLNWKHSWNGRITYYFEKWLGTRVWKTELRYEFFLNGK